MAHVTLQPYLPAEVEDVAIESLEALVEKVRELKSVEELNPLVASIAHHRAVSLLREQFAKKRGAGRTESLEAVQEANMADCPDPAANSPLAALEQKELAERLSGTLSDLKPPQGAVLTDFFLNGLSYEGIARKRGIPSAAWGSISNAAWRRCAGFGASAAKVERCERVLAMNPMSNHE